MLYGLSLLILTVFCIPILIGFGFGWNALLQHCSRNNDCGGDEMCIDKNCVYACKGKGCTQYAKCVAANHSFACQCVEGYEVEQGNKAGVCRKSCNRNENCHTSEKCQLGICIDACDSFVCTKENSVPLSYRHTCTCQCAKGFKTNLINQCMRIPTCKFHNDCHYSEECSKGRCIGLCLDNKCALTEACVAHNHTYTCGILSKLDTDSEKQSKYHERNVLAPLAQEILENILAYSMADESKDLMGSVLLRKSTEFTWPSTASDGNFKRVDNLIKTLNRLKPDVYSLNINQHDGTDIVNVANGFHIDVFREGDKPNSKLNLLQTISYFLVPEDFETSCLAVDNRAATVSLLGNFRTGKLFATNLEFIAVPYKIDKYGPIHVIFIYNKISNKILTTKVMQYLSEQNQKVFLATADDKSKLEVIVPMDLDVNTTVDIGSTLLRYALNIQTIKFTKNGRSVEFKSGEYQIQHFTSLNMEMTEDKTCDKSDYKTTSLIDKEFAMFIVSDEFTFFRAFYTLFK